MYKRQVIEKTKMSIEKYKKLKETIVVQTVTKGVEKKIEHLTYAYPESKEVLKDFCCTIRKGLSLIHI